MSYYHHYHYCSQTAQFIQSLKQYSTHWHTWQRSLFVTNIISLDEGLKFMKTHTHTHTHTHTRVHTHEHKHTHTHTHIHTHVYLTSNSSNSSKVLCSMTGSFNSSRIKLARASAERWPRYSFFTIWPLRKSFNVGYFEMRYWEAIVTENTKEKNNMIRYTW